LAVLNDKRSSSLADIPTSREVGINNFLVSSWNGLAVSAKTPKDIVARLNKEIVAVLNSPDLKKKLAELNVEARSSTPEQAADLLARETRRWGEVIIKAKIEKQ
jgi:tripartite-type tricarboxylate transporter receptor subunit TctC